MRNLLLIATLFCIVFMAAAQFDESVRFAVEFSLDGGKTWKTRGSIQTIGQNKRLAYVSSSQDNVWQKDVLHQIESNAKQQNYLYLLRLKRDNTVLVKSISTCDLIGSKFKEVLSLHIEAADKSNGGANIVSFDYSVKLLPHHKKQNQISGNGVTTSPFATSCANDVSNVASILKGGSAQFQESVSVVVANAMQAPKITFETIKPPEEKKEEEQQSFLRKYWYIVLPVGLIMLTSVMAPAPEGEGGQGAAK